MFGFAPLADPLCKCGQPIDRARWYDRNYCHPQSDGMMRHVSCCDVCREFKEATG